MSAAPTTANERTRKRIAYAVARRVALVVLLSPNGICDACKAVCAHVNMEIDHIDGITWNRYKMSPQMRAARYWREYKAGVRLRALCQPCNASDGSRRRWTR